MLQSYLADHLVGAEGGRARIRRMSETYADTEIGPGLARVAAEIDDDHAHLERLVGRLGLRQPVPLRLVARAGELLGRLKPNGRILTATPTTPLLEIELMRSAVNGKQGLWQTLAAYSAELGLDEEEYTARTATAESQSEVLEALHARVRPQAFRDATLRAPRGGRGG